MNLTKKEIENIIEDEIEVDCYTDDEVNMGWMIFMSDNINYPFEADYSMRKRDGSRTLTKVKVISSHTDEDDFFGGNYFVDAEYGDLIITINLQELKNIQADKSTLKALQIWNYRSNY